MNFFFFTKKKRRSDLEPWRGSWIPNLTHSSLASRRTRGGASALILTFRCRCTEAGGSSRILVESHQTEPGARSPESGAWSPEPGARTLKPGGSLEPEVWEPGTHSRSLQPGVRSLNPGVRSLKRGARNTCANSFFWVHTGPGAQPGVHGPGGLKALSALRALRGTEGPEGP